MSNGQPTKSGVVIRVIAYTMVFICILGLFARLLVPDLFDSPNSIVIGGCIWLVSIVLALLAARVQ